ncbi:hypothetical protein [Phreatobacter aquaticus]|uniref:hypothetical protein n=1 Tax=Phreatobacter aquaticus TaxID=2570229 RepID=UPI00208FCBEA|nr:hypothetical protein [Phreatobacter aquaticus]
MILEFWQGVGDPFRAAAVIVRAFVDIGSLATAGLALFLVFMSGELTTEETRSARRWLLLMALIGLIANFGSFPLQAIEVARGPQGAQRAEIYALVMRSPFGDALLLRSGGILLALAALARSAGAAGIATVGAVLVAASYVAAGHTTQFRPRQELVVILTLHMTALAFWFGGLLGVRAVALRRDPESAAETLYVWARQAGFFFLLALGAGLLAAWYLGGTWRSLTESWFGWIVFAKSAIVLFVLASVYAARFRHLPLMARGDVLAAAALRRSAGRQFLLGVLLIYLSAELAFVAPLDIGHRLPL